MSENSFTVSGLNRYVRHLLDQDPYLQRIWVQGEVSNLRLQPKSGILYFTLKDEAAALSCVMYSSYAARSEYIPADADKVLCFGSVSLYEAGGIYQLKVFSIRPDGEGDLAAQLEKLRRRLQEEGYFSDAHKKRIPSYPQDIAVICGEGTAAWQDVQRTVHRRWPLARIHPFFSLVQGKEAGRDIVRQIQRADQAACDVLIIARGGGSLEDLWCFNEEEVVKAIYGCRTPVITGIGHESDTTLSDYAADYRSSTPTAAAEKATPDGKDVRTLLGSYRQRLRRLADSALSEQGQRLDSQMQRFLRYGERMKQKASDLSREEESLRHLALRRAEAEQKALEARKALLVQQARGASRQGRAELRHLADSLVSTAENLGQAAWQRQKRTAGLLQAYNPLRVLQRGYSVTCDQKGRIIRHAGDVQEREQIQVRLQDGRIQGIVTGKEVESHGGREEDDL